MAKRTDIQSILIIGAGPIIIGQACEFDYSGVQACRVLREEGYRVILVNSNPATIMTDPKTADATYIEPITWETVARIIEKRRPDAILPTMGGQTALNCAMDLVHHGVLRRWGVELIGATPEAIDKAEDRERFKKLMTEIGLESARSGAAHTLEEAFAIQKTVGFPAVIRPSFTLGGTGGGIATTWTSSWRSFRAVLNCRPPRKCSLKSRFSAGRSTRWRWSATRRTTASSSARSKFGSDGRSYRRLHYGRPRTDAHRQGISGDARCSMAVLRAIGVDTGGSNVQFAVNPQNGRMIVIEMNPRVSRSSALASKATGFPIAKIAAKLAVVIRLTNSRTK